MRSISACRPLQRRTRCGKGLVVQTTQRNRNEHVRDGICLSGSGYRLRLKDGRESSCRATPKASLSVPLTQAGCAGCADRNVGKVDGARLANTILDPPPLASPSATRTGGIAFYCLPSLDNGIFLGILHGMERRMVVASITVERRRGLCFRASVSCDEARDSVCVSILYLERVEHKA